MNEGSYGCMLLLLTVVVPTALVVLIAYIYHKLTNDAFAEFAGKAGLIFNPGNFLAMTDVEPSITGKYKGLDFCLTFFYVMSGKHRYTHTSIVIHLPHVCILKNFTVTSLYYDRGFMTLFREIPYEAQRTGEKVKTGDVEFDESFLITAEPSLLPVFTPELREKLISIRDMVHIEVCDKYITFKVPCAVRNVTLLMNVTETLHYMAHRIRDVTSNPQKSLEEKSSYFSPGKERSNCTMPLPSSKTVHQKSYEVESDFTSSSSETLEEI